MEQSIPIQPLGHLHGDTGKPLTLADVGTDWSLGALLLVVGMGEVITIGEGWWVFFSIILPSGLVECGGLGECESLIERDGFMECEGFGERESLTEREGFEEREGVVNGIIAVAVSTSSTSSSSGLKELGGQSSNKKKSLFCTYLKSSTMES